MKFACFTEERNDTNFSLITNIVASTKVLKKARLTEAYLEPSRSSTMNLFYEKS